MLSPVCRSNGKALHVLEYAGAIGGQIFWRCVNEGCGQVGYEFEDNQGG